MRRHLLALASLALVPALALAQGGTDGHIVGTERTPAEPASKSPAPPNVALAPISPLAHVEQRGTGPINLILIPGLACDWRVFDAFMDRNKDGYRMWAVTLPGFGGSSPPPLPKDAKLTDLTWLNNAEAAILKLIDEQKIDKPFVAGHSMGGHLAMRLATRHPDRVRGIISIDGLPLFPPRVIPPDEDETPARRAVMAQSQNEVMRLIPPENWAKQQTGGMRYMVKSTDRAKQLGEMCAAVPRDTTIQYMCEMIVSDLRHDLQRTNSPILVVSALSLDAGQDAMKELRRSIAEQFSGAPANVQIAFFEDSRHFVMDDRPKELDAAIAAFVRRERVADVTATPTNPPADQPTIK